MYVCICIESRETRAPTSKHMAHMSSRISGTVTLWESTRSHLALLPLRCDCFVTKDGSQSDICGQIHICLCYPKKYIETIRDTYTQIRYNVNIMQSCAKF